MESPRDEFGGRLKGLGDPAVPPPAPGQTPEGRLNLLLSCAPWHPDPWVERLPTLLEPLGIRSHRAATGLEATQVIQRITPIHIAVVDLGLPLEETRPQQGRATGGGTEEGGPRLLELLSRLAQPPPIVVIKRARTHRDDCREIAAALRAGAFAVIDRPRANHDLEILLDVLRRVLHRHYHGRWPGLP